MRGRIAITLMLALTLILGGMLLGSGEQLRNRSLL
jgi:hypothetical protein